jgi:hypothetical protein
MPWWQGTRVIWRWTITGMKLYVQDRTDAPLLVIHKYCSLVICLLSRCTRADGTRNTQDCIPIMHTLSLNMEAARSSEMLATQPASIWYQNPKAGSALTLNCRYGFKRARYFQLTRGKYWRVASVYVRYFVDSLLRLYVWSEIVYALSYFLYNIFISFLDFLVYLLIFWTQLPY